MRHVAEQQETSRIKPLTEPVLLILVSLASKPQHGYALMRDICDLSQGRVEVTTGTLYGALRRLLEDGWIERFDQEDTSREKQAYRLTATGRRHLEMELDRMKQVTRIAAARLRQSPNMLLRRAYSMGLILYPADFRAQFGAEMVTVFEQAMAQHCGRGRTYVLLFFVKEMLGLLAGAARERVFHDEAIRAHDDLPVPKGTWRLYRGGSSTPLPTTNSPTLVITTSRTERHAPYSLSCVRSRVDDVWVTPLIRGQLTPELSAGAVLDSGLHFAYHEFTKALGAVSPFCTRRRLSYQPRDRLRAMQGPGNGIIAEVPY
jgi:DNA-binding PadR family transcriptional regulator